MLPTTPTFLPSLHVRHATRAAGLALGLALCAGAASAQARITFSVDPPSPTYGATDCSGAFNIRAADILKTAFPGGRPGLAAPQPVCIARRGGGGAGTLGLTMPTIANVDALSYGNDARLQQVNAPGSVWFSVVRGAHGTISSSKPCVSSEWVCGDQAASVFLDTGLPMLPTVWAAGVGENVEAIDGDGLASCNGFAAPGVGLLEPDALGAGVSGDDLDALDVDMPGPRVYFSLDGMLTDPCSGIAGNGSGPLLGFSPAAVLASNLSGAAPIVWITPAVLGLDRTGFATDDLDALAIWDNGNGSYDQPDTLLGWLNGASDMVLFSVREGSWVVGKPDSLSGAQIEPGDVLVPPVPGGVSANPGILIPAEALGLATRRSGNGFFCAGQMAADDLDGLDTTDQPQIDCDGNGIEDALDLVLFGGLDANGNGVPDACEDHQPPSGLFQNLSPRFPKTR